MPFKVDAYAVKHLWRKNCRFEYEMGNRRMRETEDEKDLGVIIHESIKPPRQCTEAAAEANKILGFVTRLILSVNKYERIK